MGHKEVLQGIKGCLNCDTEQNSRAPKSSANIITRADTVRRAATKRFPMTTATTQPPYSAAAGATPNTTPSNMTAPAIIALAVTLGLAPAIGAPIQEIYPDTLKSIVVALGSITSAILWARALQKNPSNAIFHWHQVLWLPLMLAAYALVSMAWSHAYFAGVQAIRWTLFSLITWVIIQTADSQQEHKLAIGIHIGATIASIWAALQFWFDFQFFPQAAPPASTFANRNFFAEFLVCSLPFTLYLFSLTQKPKTLLILGFNLAFNIIALMMTGTRSALLAFAFIIIFVLPLATIRLPELRTWRQWRASTKYQLAITIMSSIMILGLIPSGNPIIIKEQSLRGYGTTPFERSFGRYLSLSDVTTNRDSSFGVRRVMWKSTVNMIKVNPIIGVGAGAWEIFIPIYLPEGSELELDHHPHNEPLQLTAEYGLIGIIFLTTLIIYIIKSIRKTGEALDPIKQREAPLRASALMALTALLFVSNAGFPWHLASTAAIFATCLGILAASDKRIEEENKLSKQSLKPASRTTLFFLNIGLFVALITAIYTSIRTTQHEYAIIRAKRIGIVISDPNNKVKNRAQHYQDLLQNLRRGIEINSHNRDEVADVGEYLSKIGDWKNSVWAWESVLNSRPYVVAILANVSWGHAMMGDFNKAYEYLDRAKDIQPKARSLMTLDFLLLAKQGKLSEAQQLAHRLLDEGLDNQKFLEGSYILAVQVKDWPLAIQSLQRLATTSDKVAIDAWKKLGDIYANVPEVKNDTDALAAYQKAYDLVPAKHKRDFLRMIPVGFQQRIIQSTSMGSGDRSRDQADSTK